MRNITLIIKNEIRVTLGKRSFWIMTFLFPAFIMLINIGTQVLTQKAVTSQPAPAAGQVTGYVDQANLIQQIPASIPAGVLAAFPDEAAAMAALKSGSLYQYVLIPADYLKTGKLVVIQREFRPFSSTPDTLFQQLISYNLTREESLTAALSNPLASVETHSLAPVQVGANPNSVMGTIVPYAVMFIFFFLLSSSSSLMLNSVSQEKENRTAEVLLVTLRPRDLMVGKLIGLSFVALVQIVLWFGGALILLGSSGQLFSTAASFKLPQGFFLYAPLYFLLGYLMNASLMGAIGAIAPSSKEAGSYTLMVILPMMLPLLFNVSFTQSPNGTLPVILSLFPLSAPTAMITRLVSVNVPLWQIGASLAGLAVTTYLLVLLSARFFRADNLLSTTALKFGRLVAEATRK